MDASFAKDFDRRSPGEQIRPQGMERGLAAARGSRGGNRDERMGPVGGEPMKETMENFIPRDLMENIPMALLKCSSDGFYAVDKNCKYVFWSESMKAITGISES